MSPPPPFSRFLDDHREAVYRFLVATVGPDEADDCFQETFIKALRAYPRLRDAANLRGWVLTIARRTAIDAARGRRRRPQPAADPEPPPSMARRTSGIRRCGRPSAACRPASARRSTLRYVNDLSYADVGRVIGSSEDAARRSAFEGLRRLREVWDER